MNWQGLGFQGPGSTEPFMAMPAATVLRRTVKLQPTADLTYTLRDEASERRRLLAVIATLKKHAIDAGYEFANARVEWRDYAEESTEAERPTAVLILYLQNSSRDRRRHALLNLLELLAEQEDSAVRERLSIRVR